METKISYLNMIQNIINRMAKNCFALKGWAVTLVAGVFALAAKDTNAIYFLIAYIPIVSFWLLDAYYLQQERLFRSLYNYVRNLNEEQIDFDMNTDPFKQNEKNSYFDCLFSVSELIYLPLALTPIVVIILK